MNIAPELLMSMIQILAIFSKSKCGILFPQKNIFVIVFYTVINIQFS